MDLTQINVLTKIDNLHKFPPLPFNLEYYTEVQDLEYLLPSLEKESPMFATGKFQALNEAVTRLIEDFGLVGYETLAVENKKSMMGLLRTIDRAGGYVFGGAEGAGDSIWQTAVRQGVGPMDIRDVQDRWIDNKEEWDEIEAKQEEERQRKLEEEFEQSASSSGVAGVGTVDESSSNVPLDGSTKVRRTGPK